MIWDGRPAATKTGGFVSSSGPWSTSLPPNATTGLSVAITVPGVYLLHLSATGYSTVVNANLDYTLYIDSVPANALSFFFNQANVHATLPTLAAEVTLTASTHYAWFRFSGSSDTNDRLTLTWRRI